MHAMLSHTRCTASSRERDDESPNDAGNEMPVKLLSEAQVKQFVATCVCPKPPLNRHILRWDPNDARGG